MRWNRPGCTGYDNKYEIRRVFVVFLSCFQIFIIWTQSFAAQIQSRYFGGQGGPGSGKRHSGNEDGRWQLGCSHVQQVRRKVSFRRRLKSKHEILRRTWAANVQYCRTYFLERTPLICVKSKTLLQRAVDVGQARTHYNQFGSECTP